VGTVKDVLLFIVSILIFGLIIGLLGRLIVPGRNSMGLFKTALVGIVGALIGGFIAKLIWKAPATHHLGFLICEVLGAAVIVALVSRSGGRRRRRVYL
jgi:uncharacterized membrane protein YeaQ/YmgE (transglycosylase-associated protein family)